MASNEFNRVSVNDWETQLLRASAFLPPRTNLSPDKWWEENVGSAPDTSAVRAKVGERVQQGMALGGQLTLQIRGSRIDWLLTAGAPPDAKGPVAPSALKPLGRFNDLYPQFSEIIERWLRTSPPLIRIAYGVSISLPVKDRVDGYRQLVPYLPQLKIDPEGSSDLIYRINRKRPSRSGIEKLEINRLSSWSVAILEFKHFELTGDAQANLVSGEPSFTCHLELDINTSPTFSGNFTVEQSVNVFEELKELALEIIEKGDVS
jgi:hypothetical protein